MTQGRHSEIAGTAWLASPFLAEMDALTEGGSMACGAVPERDT
jgi:hypothetical protein